MAEKRFKLPLFQTDFFCDFLGNRILSGYGWMNYQRNENELSVIAKKIFKYKFKREDLEIYNGANTEEILSYGEWEERCKDLLDTFFARDITSSGIILFPDIKIVLRIQISQTEMWQRVMTTLNAWCHSSCPKDPTGLIIRNYDFEDHLNFCGITKYEIRDTLVCQDSENMFNFQDSNNRFLAFNPSLKVILIIRLVELLEGKSQLLKNEVNYCIMEVNLLCFLLRDESENTGVIVMGLVAYSGENSHSQSPCKDCGNMIVPFEIFTSVKTFKKFLKKFFNEKKMEDLAKTLATREIIEKANVFQAVASKILGYLAHLQFVMLKDPILPVKKNDATSNIKQAELLLDRYQMEIAYSDDKRIWLVGNYGTGKTVVALKKLELLLKILKDKEVIYYINFAGKSYLDFVIKQKFKNNEKVRTIRGGFSLSNIVNTQILRKEREVDTKNIHLIVDEYSSQDLSTEEATSLGKIFREEEEFKHSTVLIAAQPIKISGRNRFYDENDVKKEFYQKRNELNELIQITGMKVKTLNNVMRTTVQINTLVELTQQYLNNQSNQYVHQERHYQSSSNRLKMTERIFDRTLFILPQKLSSVLRSSLSIFSSNSSNSVTSLPFPFTEVAVHDLEKTNSKEIDSKSLFKNEISKSSSLVKVAPDDSSVTSDSLLNTATSSSPSQSQRIIDYDELFKLMPTGNISQNTSYHETVTEYCYTCESRIGHNILGPLPQLIKLAETADHCEQVALIASVLDKIITPVGRTAVIHFEPDDPPFWLKSLFQITDVSSSLTMTTDLEKFLIDTSENLVLVKNLNFVKGLEFSNILLILDSNEHHLRHFIPDAIARCTSNLSILI